MRLRPVGVTAPLWLLVCSALCLGSQSDPEREELGTALRHALDGSWDALRIDAECLTETGFHSVYVIGNGIVIWDRVRQSRQTDDAIRAQLEAFREADFARMLDRYGGKNEPGAARQPPGILCRVKLDLDGANKEVVQLEGGQQSTALRRLAERLFDLSRPFAESGTGADDLGDGLAKVESGGLAPETFLVTVQRRTDGEGWLLRLEGLKVTLRLFRQGEGFGDSMELALDEKELRGLAGLLLDQELGELPTNMYAEHYTDLGVEVLNREKRIQARSFGRLSPTSLGEKQERFDRIFGELMKLRARVLEQAQVPDE